MANAGQPYTQEDGAQVRRLACDEGMSDPQIAEALGISRSRVKRIRERFNIASPRPEARKPDLQADAYRYVKPLPPAELERLRRAVGFRPGMLDGPDDDGPVAA